MTLLRVATAVTLLLAAQTAQGQDSEQLPPPKQALPKQALPKQALPAPAAPQLMLVPPPLLIMSEPPPRMDSRNGWAYFAPNSMGQLRYRVIMSPYQNYYMYNGRPYYGLSVRSPYILPRTTD